MRLLDRYLLRELLTPLRYCLIGFVIFWTAFDLTNGLKRFQENKLGFGDVVEYELVKLPETLVLVLPIGLLLALLYAVTNHARNNELTAMRAAGVSLWRICAPYFVVGFFFSMVLLAINELLVPDSSQRADAILARHAERAGPAVNRDVQTGLNLRNSRDHRTWLIPAYNRRTAVMTNPTVYWTTPDGAYRQIVAESAERVGGVWTFHEVQEYQGLPGAVGSWSRTNLLAMPEFTETPEQFRREGKLNERLNQKKAEAPEIPLLDLIEYLNIHRDLPSSQKWWLYTQLHGRLAAPWTCLVVVLIAIPFGAASGRRNVFFGVAGSIVICFTYFILLHLGLALGTGGYVPAWAGAWLPNASFATAGAWLMLRVR